MEANLASARILVVDDDPDGRTVLEAMLTARRAVVTVCGDGYQALELLRTDRFDAAVVDLMMPGAGGLDVLRRAFGVTGAPPIVIVTALGQGDLIEQALAAGAAEVVHKPFTAEAITTAVGRAIERSGPR